MQRVYQICTRCIMDTSDPDIIFDEHGICNHCHEYDRKVERMVITGEAGREELNAIAEQIRKEGKGKEYDCIVGVSGGVDSTFVAYNVKKLGLRALAVHLDNGWDSELAVKNIENTLKKLGIELFTYVIDWEEFKDLQLAFLKASTPDSEIPTDHAILAILHHTAAKFGIRYVIAGFNARTESHHPRAWSQGYYDWRYIRSIQKRFGTKPLVSFPHITFLQYHWYILHQRWINILNYIDYVKKDAITVLEQELGWRYYGGKHYESIYTRFFQGYILPKKFGFDKRRSHFSSLICSGEITRDEALKEMEKETYPMELQQEDREYVIKKLGITSAEFDAIMNLPPQRYLDYPSHDHFFRSFPYRAARAFLNRVRKRSLPIS